MDLDRYNKEERADGSILLTLKKDDLDWKPKGGERYYYVGASGKANGYKYCHDDIDQGTVNSHNVFKTEAQAEKASKLQRVSNAIIRACLLVDPEYDQGWNKDNYCPGFFDGWGSTEWTVYKLSPAYVSTKEKAEQVCILLTAWGIKP